MTRERAGFLHNRAGGRGTFAGRDQLKATLLAVERQPQLVHGQGVDESVLFF